MAFTALELENIANSTIDYHMKKVHTQSVQEKPLLAALEAAQKTFPGGRDNITVRVKGDYTTTFEGYSDNDAVSYANPANVKQASYPWREGHAGIEITHTELKKVGIIVLDTMTGENTGQASEAELIQLANLLEDKLEDMSEGYSRGKNLMYWLDGAQDPQLPPGVKSIVVDDSTAPGIVGGIDQAKNAWWRNRALLNIAATPANAADNVLINRLQTERRQLRRYGGRPSKAFCGSDFLDQLEAELRARGVYTQTGWQSQGKIDVGMADVQLKDIEFIYDPTLDDQDEAKRAYILDLKTIYPMVMDGEADKKHAPARPATRYSMFRAVTWTGGLVCKMRNANGVYSIA